jgi:hypothetical protein
MCRNEGKRRQRKESLRLIENASRRSTGREVESGKFK